ncbi:probable G-protein coupled receptor Mth-like 2 [Calliphora vicina]|uniref:probable G-protein coupled receptor Mth-like 2 n=1 Tax=Calliphora vicina TaxID=7373 RepID=UPI00325A92A3
MNLKQLIIVIQIILLRNRIHCYAENHKFTSQGVNKSNQSNKGNILNDFQTQNNILTSSNVSSIYRNAKNSNQQYQSTAESIADLYFFSSHDVMGIFNCSYENTINITNNTLLANGSYIYDNQTLVPPQLVGSYDYEILYNGSRRKVPLHKRACICHLKPCISLCSNDISETYQYVINNAMYDALDIFSINVNLNNGLVATKNIVKDFAPIEWQEFCAVLYMLTPEINVGSDWTLFENGSLLLESDGTLKKRNEYCFDLQRITIEGNSYDLINPKICAKTKIGLTYLELFNYWIQVLSIIFLLFTMIVYCCLPELLNVHGKCLMSYVASLALSFAIFSFLYLSQSSFDLLPCLIMAYLNYYLQLSYYTWLGIICYDIWRSFSDFNYKSSYGYYSKFGYPLPFLMTFLTFCAQNLITNEDLKPGISADRCGLDVFKWSGAIYLYGPCLIILLCCLTFFILTSKIIKTNDREIKEIYAKDSPESRYSLILRLFVMMGISWFLDIISYVLYMFGLTTVSGIIDYINSLQGVYIFINFIGRPKTHYMLKKRYYEWKTRKGF